MAYLRAVIFLAALNLLAGNIPGIMPQLSRLSGLLTLVALIGLFRPHAGAKLSSRLPAAVFCLLSLPLLLAAEWYLVGLGILLLSLQALFSPSEEAEQELPAFLLTTALYALFITIYRLSPHVWFLARDAATGFSAAVSNGLGNGMTLGHTAMGLFISVSVFCYGLALSLTAPRKIRSLLLTLTAVGAANIVFLRLQAPLGAMARRLDSSLQPTPLDWQGVLLLLLLLAVLPLHLLAKSRMPVALLPLMPRRQLFYPLLLAAAAGLLLALPPKPLPARNGSILFCDRGASWSMPLYDGKYGQTSVGMYGILPQYLKMRGYETKVSKEPLTEEALRDVALVVVFSPEHRFAEAEKKYIHEFVKNGGSLLVAGDHSDVLGIMDPINDLLAPFSIALRFDTALPIKSGWIDSLEFRPHSVTRGIEEDYEPSLWVGASLAISPPAEPVIVGTRGWADTGSRKNVKNAFLGDYKRSADEQLGDVVLVAASSYGSGKVLVFGDTSTFQNATITISHPFIDTMTGWLTHQDQSPSLPRLSAALLLAAAALVLAGRKLNSFSLLLLLAMMGALTWSIDSGKKIPAAAKAGRSDPARAAAFYEPAYIDNAHLSRFAVYSPADNGVWGASVSLLRNAFVPLLYPQFSEPALMASGLCMVIAPTIPFAPAEIALLRRFMEKGGILIWSVGWEDAAASQTFLEEFGFSIDAVPLGRATGSSAFGSLTFFEAWPVQGGGDTVEVLARKEEFPLIVYQPQGRGGLVLIGDSGFLLNKNLESYTKHDINNVRFFKSLMEKLGRGRNRPRPQSQPPQPVEG